MTGRTRATDVEPDANDAYDSQMIVGHDGRPIDPKLLALIRDARDEHGVEAVGYAAVHVDLARHTYPDAIEAMHRTVGVVPPEGMAAIQIPIREPRVLLAWGDNTITEVADDGYLIAHGFGTFNQLQRQLMVARLRFIAELLENGPPPAEPGLEPGTA